MTSRSPHYQRLQLNYRDRCQNWFCKAIHVKGLHYLHTEVRGVRELFHWRFASSPKYYLEICVMLKSYFSCEFQAQTVWAQSHGLGTRTKFQFELLSINAISGIVHFRKIILESSRNVSESTTCILKTALGNAFVSVKIESGEKNHWIVFQSSNGH